MPAGETERGHPDERRPWQRTRTSSHTHEAACVLTQGRRRLPVLVMGIGAPDPKGGSWSVIPAKKTSQGTLGIFPGALPLL